MEAVDVSMTMYARPIYKHIQRQRVFSFFACACTGYASMCWALRMLFFFAFRLSKGLQRASSRLAYVFLEEQSYAAVRPRCSFLPVFGVCIVFFFSKTFPLLSLYCVIKRTCCRTPENHLYAAGFNQLYLRASERKKKGRKTYTHTHTHTANEEEKQKRYRE